MKISQVAVIGAGNMGSGIAQKIAHAGTTVLLIDTTQERADAGKARAQAVLAEGVTRRLFTPTQAEAILERIQPKGDLKAVAAADLVIEAVFEDRKIKEALFAQLGELTRPDAILATNTSSFLVADLARVTRVPERVIGLHYFYHPAKNRLVEVIGHATTRPEVLAAAWAFQEQTGKTPIACKDAPGFVVNRFFVPWLNEAVRLHEEGHSIASIEAASKAAFGIGMGPFELMNVTGVPIALHATRSLGEALGPFYAPARSLATQVESGKPWDLQGTADPAGDAAIAARLWGVALHVALALTSEGVAKSDDVDIGARVGLRWAAGPFETMSAWGLEQTTKRVMEVQERYQLATPARLTQHLEHGRDFTTERVRLDVREGIATILLNRPDQLNALDPVTVMQLEAHFDRAIADSAVRGIVLAGAGKAFVAGADVKFFVDNLRSNKLDAIATFATHAQGVFRRLEASPKRVVCRLDGLALGGGAELMLACHAVVATADASMAFPETGIGIYPGLGGTQRLTRRLGRGLSRLLLYTGMPLTAEQLVAVGLAWRVVAPEALLATLRAALVDAPVQPVLAPEKIPSIFAADATWLANHDVDALLAADNTTPLADKARRKAPLALRAVERLTAYAETHDLQAGLTAETASLRPIFSSADAFEGLTALLEKRRPKFTGA